MKRKLKMTVDSLMVIGMFCALNYQIWSGSAHKRISAGLFLLFILHNMLNFRWYRTLFRGKYRPMRMIQTVINFGVMLSMAAVMYSGILLAKEMAAGILVEGMSFARGMHIGAGYLGALGIAAHTGLHIKAVRIRMRKVIAPNNQKMIKKQLTHGT